MDWVCDNCGRIDKALNLIYMKDSPFLVGCTKNASTLNICFAYCTSCFFDTNTNCEKCGVYKAGYQCDKDDECLRVCFICKCQCC
jgi:hypothetical protein